MPSRLHLPPRRSTLQPPECRTEQLLPNQLDFACRTFEKFLTGLSALLPGYLYTPATIRFATAEQRPYSSALADLADFGCTVLLDLSPFPHCARLAFGQRFLFAALETLLGAPPGVGGLPRESLTDVDLRILQGLIDLAIAELRSAWHPQCGASFRKISIGVGESNVSDAEEQSALILTAEIVTRESADTLRLILPSLLIRLIAQTGRKPSTPAGDSQKRALLEALSGTYLDIEAVIRGTDIRVRDLLALKPGMVLEVPRKSGTPIECQVNGVSKFRGGLVNIGKFVGFRIESLWEGGELVALSRPKD